jgi:leader peptidase (prepilin peptidase)/N-methyltransferase
MPGLDSLPSHPWLMAAWAACFGACIGSFLNVVVFRLPRRQSVVTPPSRCPSCQARIAPWDNLPVVSWLLLRGRCRRCRAPISLRYPLVEAFTAALAVLCVLRFGATAHAASAFTLLCCLTAIALIDWEHMIIPDPLSLGLLAVGLLLAPLCGPGLWRALLGAVVGGGLLLVVGLVWEKARKVEAMGGGDVKLMGAVGAFLGATGALLTIFLGALLGAIYGTAVLRRGGQAKVAFGTFLSVAAFVVVFLGRELVRWYAAAAGLAR